LRCLLCAALSSFFVIRVLLFLCLLLHL
jgi:hypothetical protein